jgi:translation initiation factor 2B subunit (eIF-2B alpha/beta/delta family)
VIADYTKRGSIGQRRCGVILNKKVDSERALIERAINGISIDNRSGAAEILRRAGEVFSSLAASKTDTTSIDTEYARQLLIETCAEIVRAQPHMAVLANLASQVASTALSADDVLTAAARSAHDFIDKVDRAILSATDNAAQLIKEGSVVLTHSRSSTVIAAFKKAREQGRTFSVIATESRPQFEGRRLAAALAGLGINVVFIADAAAAIELSRADFVLVGADTITPQFLVNKIGTRMIALAARELNLSVYALSDTSKLIDAELFSGAEGDRHSTAELWTDPTEGVVIMNRYFEPTPLHYFTKIITEDGLLDPVEARKRAEGRRLNKTLRDALQG